MYTYTCLKESTHAIYVCSKVLQYQSNLLIEFHWIKKVYNPAARPTKS